MINALNYRIKCCIERIKHYEDEISKTESDSLKMYYRGIVDAKKSQLATLQELLVTAQTLEKLSETA